MRVLIAPDSFKGSLRAAAVAAALAEGWLSVRPDDQVIRLPLADGGEGTLDVLAATVPGARWHRARVHGPAGVPVVARWLSLPATEGRGDGTPGGSPWRGQNTGPLPAGSSGRGSGTPGGSPWRGQDSGPLPAGSSGRGSGTPGGSPWRGQNTGPRLPPARPVPAGADTAVVELARASGLPLLARPEPTGAQTTGLGELLGRALDFGAGRILVGLGGSAATDGGTGALAALGARFLDAARRPLPPGGGALAALDTVDLSGLRPPPPGGVICLTDVTAPLLGPRGAAAVFGPQKGADVGQVARLEAGLGRLAEVLGGEPAAPGAGAAGGTGYGLATAWGAILQPGAAELARLAGLDRALSWADLVVTGEGRFDETSLTGKTCGTVIAAAAAAGVPVVMVAGQVSDALAGRVAGQVSDGVAESMAGDDGLPVAGPTPGGVMTLTGLAGGTAAAMASPRRWLRAAGGRLAGDAGGGKIRG